jgi:hypothetical protein
MKRNLASISLLLFGVSILILLGWTMFESALTGIPTGTERIATVALLILPAGIGAGLGAMSLIHREGQTGLAITGIILNTFFALFHLMIVLFAG